VSILSATGLRPYGSKVGRRMAVSGEILQFVGLGLVSFFSDEAFGASWESESEMYGKVVGELGAGLLILMTVGGFALGGVIGSIWTYRRFKFYSYRRRYRMLRRVKLRNRREEKRLNKKRLNTTLTL
jgi:hypothetical protein